MHGPERLRRLHVHPKTLVEIAMVLATNSGSFPLNSHVSATFSILLTCGEFWNQTNCEKFNADWSLMGRTNCDKSFRQTSSRFEFFYKRDLCQKMHRQTKCRETLESRLFQLRVTRFNATHRPDCDDARARETATATRKHKHAKCRGGHDVSVCKDYIKQGCRKNFPLR